MSITGKGVAYRAIPRSVRRTHGFLATTPAHLERWEPRFGSTDGAFDVRDRRMPGCDQPPEGPVKVDRSVKDFAGLLTRDGDFVVSRQVTIYESDTDAEFFAKQWGRDIRSLLTIPGPRRVPHRTHHIPR